MNRVDCAYVVRPLLQSMDQCGDTAIYFSGDDTCFLALADVLGHGAQARDVAILAEQFLNSHSERDLLSVVVGLHRSLTGTRGAVATVCRLDLKTGMLSYTGVGNVSMKLVGRQSEQMVTTDGVIGYGSISPYVCEQRIYPGTTLLLYSDGVSGHINLLERPGILLKSAAEIAAWVVERFGSNDDDASCIALKYLKQ